MIEAGWYPDYEHAAQLRYHDGAQWTEHVHVAPLAEAPPPIEPPVVDQVIESPAPKQDAAWVRAISFPLAGLFCGLILGGFLFNAIGAITPVTETTGTVERLDIEYSQSSGTQNGESYVLFGSTVDGDPWRIVNEDAYNVLQSEGYPQQVTLFIGDWTDMPERVVGTSFDVNHQTTGARIGWGLMLAISALIVAVVTALIARGKNSGAVSALLFAFFLLGPGTWLGFQAFQWIQSG